MIKKIKEISGLFSVAGYENQLTSYILNEAKSFCDECCIDKIGNVILRKKGNGDKVLINTPISSDGLFITFITDDLKGHFKALGNLEASKIQGKAVVNENGDILGIIKGESSDSDEIDNLYIDFGVDEKKDIPVSEGAVLSLKKEFYEIKNSIFGSDIEKGVNIYTILSLIKEIESDCDLYFAFTVMDNIGFKGAKTAAYEINPDYAVILSHSFFDGKEGNVKAGKGAALRITDSHFVSNKKMRDFVIDKLNAGDIPYQVEILSKEGLVNNEIMYMNNGILSINLNLPVSGSGELIKGVKIKDIELYEKAIKEILG